MRLRCTTRPWVDLAVVELLVERGARLDLQDKIYSGTPLGWA